MELLIDHWYLFISGFAVIVAAGVLVFKFTKLPKENQIRKVKEWLLLAVTEAEKTLGSGTGQLKLRYVYDMFIQRFNWLVKIVSFDMFSEWVDEALIEMRKMLLNNEAVADLVGNDEEGVI